MPVTRLLLETTALKEEKSYVIRDQAALDALIAAHDAAVDEQGRTYSPGYVAPKRLGLSPAVDFSRQTVFALARDDSPIRSIRQVGEQVRIEYLSKRGSSDNVDVATPAPRFKALEIVVTNLRGDEVRDVSFVDVNSAVTAYGVTVLAGSNATTAEAGQVLIKSRAELDALIRTHLDAEAARSLEAVTVDFDKEIVVGVFLGKLPRRCHAIGQFRALFYGARGELVTRYEYKQAPAGTCADTEMVSRFVLARVPAAAGEIKEVSFLPIAVPSLRPFTVLDEQNVLTQVFTKSLIWARDASEMALLWRQYKTPTSAASMPIVDFSKYVVLGLFHGSGDGCSQIRADTVEGTRIAGEFVVVSDVTPTSDICTSVLIYPGQLIAIPR